MRSDAHGDGSLRIESLLAWRSAHAGAATGLDGAPRRPRYVQELTPEQMGDLYMARKHYRRSRADFQGACTDKNPTNAVYLNKLGIALHQQEALTLAMKYYEKALKANPKYADAENNIGTIWYQRKRFGKAIKAYEKAIKINDDMAVLYSNLGYAYLATRSTKSPSPRSASRFA